MSSTDEDDALPPGWKSRESRSKPGVIYYIAPDGKTQWKRPRPEMDGSAVGNVDGNAKKRQKKEADETVHVLHILAKHAGSRRPKSWRQSNITISLEEAKDRIETFRKQIVAVAKSEGNDAAKKLFKDIATKESDCSSHRDGGDLGPFGRKMMQPPFEEAAFAFTSEGEVSDIVISNSGVHILYCLKPRPLERMRFSHILKKSSDAVRVELAELRQQILEAAEGDLDVLRETFGEMAAGDSEDDKTSSKNGDLGLLARGSMGGDFDTAAFSLAVGELSNVVETPDGLHLILRTE
eukprot:g1537.t1